MGTYYMENNFTLMLDIYFYINYKNYEKNGYNFIWIC